MWIERMLHCWISWMDPRKQSPSHSLPEPGKGYVSACRNGADFWANASFSEVVWPYNSQDCCKLAAIYLYACRDTNSCRMLGHHLDGYHKKVPMPCVRVAED